MTLTTFLNYLIPMASLLMVVISKVVHPRLLKAGKPYLALRFVKSCLYTSILLLIVAVLNLAHMFYSFFQS